MEWWIGEMQGCRKYGTSGTMFPDKKVSSDKVSENFPIICPMIMIYWTNYPMMNIYWTNCPMITINWTNYPMIAIY